MVCAVLGSVGVGCSKFRLYGSFWVPLVWRRAGLGLVSVWFVVVFVLSSCCVLFSAARLPPFLLRLVAVSSSFLVLLCPPPPPPRSRSPPFLFSLPRFSSLFLQELSCSLRKYPCSFLISF